MKYQIAYQDYDDGKPGVVSAFLETQNVKGSPGTVWEPENVELVEAKRLLLTAIRDGYRVTGDVTREILSSY